MATTKDGTPSEESAPTPPTPAGPEPARAPLPPLPPLPTGAAMHRDRNPGGRPLKLTPELQDQIVTAVTAGVYLETAAQVAGVSRNTLFDWMKRGHAARKAGRLDSKFAVFLGEVDRALAVAEKRLVESLERAAAPRVEQTTTTTTQVDAAGNVVTKTTVVTERPADGDWRAAGWSLERKFPDRYGLTQRIRVETDRAVDELLEKLGDALPTETFRQVLVAVGRAAEDQGEGAPGDTSTDPADPDDG